MDPGRWGRNLELVIVKLISKIDILSILVKLPSGDMCKTSLMIVNIGSGNGLVPSGTKPLPKPMLTKFYDTIGWHKSGSTLAQMGT